MFLVSDTQLQYFEVYVGQRGMYFNDATSCASSTQVGSPSTRNPGRYTAIPCRQYLSGRYIVLRKLAPSTTGENFLTLCDIKVFSGIGYNISSIDFSRCHHWKSRVGRCNTCLICPEFPDKSLISAGLC